MNYIIHNEENIFRGVVQIQKVHKHIPEGSIGKIYDFIIE